MDGDKEFETAISLSYHRPLNALDNQPTANYINLQYVILLLAFLASQPLLRAKGYNRLTYSRNLDIETTQTPPNADLSHISCTILPMLGPYGVKLYCRGFCILGVPPVSRYRGHPPSLSLFASCFEAISLVAYLRR
jgi:hypothetical protein